MFRRVFDRGATPITFTFDGRKLQGRQGDTVAAALLGEGVATCRTTTVSVSPRGPYCLMGVCFECLVTIDGSCNHLGCLVTLTDGMCVETQVGAPPADEESSA